VRKSLSCFKKMGKEAKIKCGVAGVGYLGKQHARIYNDLEQCELVGICEVDDEKANEICSLYNCQRFASIKELGKACDAVSVVVPTDKHCEVAMPLLEAGCHLLIEKPLCVSLEEASCILQLAKRNKCMVQVGHIEHYNPVMNFLEEFVNEPRFITADRLAPFNPRGTEVGVVLDLMIHDIGVILQLVNSPIARIESIGVNVLSQHEDIANARITFQNGCVANLNTSRVSLKKIREIRVFQAHKYLSLDFMNQKGHILYKDNDNLTREDVPIERGEALKIELAAFIDCVEKGTDPKVGVTLGTSALEVAIEITQQIREQDNKFA